MTMATIFAATANRQELTWLKTICLLFLLVHLVSGCALLNNSVKFYQNQPRRPINWREYTSD
jgi:ABC-type arginine transport system permease subunit